MSEAREKYIQFESDVARSGKSIAKFITDYITELEQQNMQLQIEYNESREYNSKLAKDNFEFIKENANLEQQNKELLEFAKEMREIGMLNPDRLPEYTDIIYHHANDLITRITGGE